MGGLVEFLRARLDELEAAAKASEGAWIPLGPNPDDQRPIARLMSMHNPAYVLADIAAKRRIVELHAGEHGCREFASGIYPADAHLMNETPGARWEHATSEYFEDRPCETLLLLAAPFFTHPAYNPAWAV